MTKGYPRVLLETQEASPTQHQDSTKLLNTSKKLLQKTAFSLIPTFIQRRLRSTSSNPYRIHPTSYLDGLRGVASLIVFMGHYTEENLGWYQEPYGLYEDGAPSSPLQLPFLRVLYSARPMVHIFFVRLIATLDCYLIYEPAVWELFREPSERQRSLKCS